MKKPKTFTIAGLMMILAIARANPFAHARQVEDAPDVVRMTDALALSRVGSPTRAPIQVDPVVADVVAGRWAMPKAGDAVTMADGSERTWQSIQAGDNGAFGGPAIRGGYLAAEVASDADRLMILEASGHSMLYVDGAPRPGDPYGNGWLRLPVTLRAGRTPLLFAAGRGAIQARLIPPRARAQLETVDTTLPDIVAGEPIDTWGALVVLNASDQVAGDLALRVVCGAAPAVITPIPPMIPLATRKVGFRIVAPAAGYAGQMPVTVALIGDADGQRVVLDQVQLDLAVRTPEQSHKRTFLSNIDGSVQYYAVQPMSAGRSTEDRPALFLSLHGASVEAIGQANAYAPKDWGHIVSPTNRRPYGFDWEDWGRLDAMEVLEIARESLGTDPRRTYLTGHSMGGHGTWHLGVTFPDRWAAIAPSAGWVSMWSYAGATKNADDSPVASLFARASSPSDTLTLAPNLRRNGVYILHGDRDDNVPVAQARLMRAELGSFHPDFAYYEQPGAGHWWGNECVDWPPLFAFFERHTHPEPGAIRRVEFTTASPGVSARCDWLTIEQQAKWLAPSRVVLDHDPENRSFRGTTENVARLALDLAHLDPGEPVKVVLDDDECEVPWPAEGSRIWLATTTTDHDDDTAWSPASRQPRTSKGPHRYGPFKDAYRNRVQFVYGTQGSLEENAWALARVRFDAETFGYRGNGSIDVIADTAFDPAAEPDRNVVLYGNADTNAAWATLLGDSPVQVGQGAIQVGDRVQEGDDLACLFLRPRSDSTTASVAAVSGTGAAGMRLTDRLPVFVSGVAYPDMTILGPDVLERGVAGIVAAGFFGNDWSIDQGEFAWAD